MDKSISIKITYWAFVDGAGVEDFADIDQFKQELAEAYPGLVKALPSGRGGSVYQFIIDFVFNGSLEDYLKLLAGYLGGKAVDKVAEPILNKYLFRPLQEAYTKLRNKNKGLDSFSISIELSDTKIIIYKVGDEDIVDKIELILAAIGQHYKNLWHDGDFPFEIHIPALRDEKEGTIFYRPPLGEDESLQLTHHDYNKGYWGIMTFRTGLSCVYDLDKKVIDRSKFFITEEGLNAGHLSFAALHQEDTDADQ
jgi:hypothetical protein